MIGFQVLVCLDTLMYLYEFIFIFPIEKPIHQSWWIRFTLTLPMAANVTYFTLLKQDRFILGHTCSSALEIDMILIIFLFLSMTLNTFMRSGKVIQLVNFISQLHQK